MKREAEALYRAYLNSRNNQDEVMSEIIQAIAKFDERQHENTMELSERVHGALSRLSQGLGGPPPLPDVVGEFAEAVRRGGYQQ